MKILLDTLDLKEISKYNDLSLIDGITTNPTFSKRYGMSDDVDVIKQISKIIGKDCEIHIESFGETAKEIISNALDVYDKANRYNNNLVFKIPFSKEGLIATKKLKTTYDLKTNIHLVFSVNQALLAAKVGSDYICPLVGRLDDIGHNSLQDISDIKEGFMNNNITTKIMISSVRHPKHIMDYFKLGVDAITIPPSVMNTIIKHPLTSLGINVFGRDFNLIRKIKDKAINCECVVDYNTSLSSVLKLMDVNKSSAIAITKKDELYGVFTAGDLRRLFITKKKIVGDDIIGIFAKTNPKTIDMEESVEDAITLMKKHNIVSLIVLDKEKVVGTIDDNRLYL